MYTLGFFFGGGRGDYKITPTKPYRILLMELDNYILFRRVGRITGTTPIILFGRSKVY
jgi:hypothetical protein